MRAQLFSNAVPFRYKAVLHEYLEVPPGSTRGVAYGIHTHVSHDGARSRNPRKFLDDAELLETALSTETDPFLVSRYTFYLAQSYRDAGELQEAIDAYLRRAQMGFWIEEVFISLYRVAQLLERLERPVDDVIAAYLRAYEVIPARAEALYGAAKLCRIHGRYHLGYLLAREGLSLPEPERSLFVDRSVYEYGLLDEFQINAYWSGHYQESHAAGQRLLEESKFPDNQRARLVANADFATKKVDVEKRN